LLFNAINFFAVEVPMVIIAFLLLRVIFTLLFKYPISRFLRKFDLWGYFLIIIFDGNVQQFAFYLTAELRNVFYFSFGDQCLKAAILLFGFLLVTISVGGFIIAYGIYGKLNKYLVDNNRNNLKGNAAIVLQYGLRNILLGILHSILRPLPYKTLLSILISTELLFLVIFIISIAFMAYRSLKLIWIYLLLAFIRILLIFTFFFDYSLPE
jgi:hypothetical protein